MATQDSAEWWEAYSHIIKPAFETFLKDESQAAAITSYCMSVVPGLLQTEGYASALLQNNYLFYKDDYAAVLDRVNLRMERQWRVWEGNRLKRSKVLLGGRALNRKIGGAELLREQLIHLTEMAALPNVTLQVVPQDYYDSPFLIEPGSCHIFEFGSLARPDILYEELERPGHPLSMSDNPMEVEYYRQALEKISHASLGPEESIQFLHKKIAALANEQ